MPNPASFFILQVIKNIIMKKLVYSIFIASVVSQTVNAQTNQMNYPTTDKKDVIDVYFNTKIADPYRWLEDDRSAETAAWVTAQNNVTFAYLDQIPYRDQLIKTADRKMELRKN